MEDFIYNHKKGIIVAVVAIFVVILGVGVYNIIWKNIHSAKVNMIIAPSIAKVRIGDDVYDAVGEYNIMPGEYVVEVYAEGFISRTGNLVAIKGETTNISLFLEPEDENSDWYNTHSADALIMGEVKNNQTVQSLQKLGDEFPILNILPYSADYFTDNYSRKVKYDISYKTNSEDTSFVIIITDYMGGARDLAYAWLKENGVDINDYAIEYKDISAEWNITGNAG